MRPIYEIPTTIMDRLFQRDAVYKSHRPVSVRLYVHLSVLYRSG